jgi:hypothetical protein
MDATEEQERRRLRFTAWVRGTGATSRQIDEATGTNMGGHYTTAASQPAIMTREHLEQCRHLLGDVPEWVEREADIRTVESRNMAEREVVGKNQWTNSAAHFVPGENHAERVNLNITAPATPEAQQWQGWGTALKPALEPITVARKPLIGTVAENVLAHGTGGINVDGCRVGDEVRHAAFTSLAPRKGNRLGAADTAEARQGTQGDPKEYTGRWPANLIHDGSEEVTALLGEAARFFYTAKADKSDRGPGNNHPTVKPVDLMRYLVRLVCPIGGVVLDPFSGSGTTLAAAQAEGCLAIGVEREAAYCEIIKGRFHQRRLF